MAIRQLNENEQRWILDDIFSAVQIDQTLKKIELSRREFSQYLRENPEFDKLVSQAEVDACRFLANDLINIHKKFDGSEGSHKIATVYSNNILRILAANMPEKYGNKIDLNLNAQISIKENLGQSNKRISELVRDVSPVLIAIGQDVSLSDKK